jgi:hypothetical protein
VRLAGAEAAAGALMRLPVDGAFLEEKFWPEQFARATQQKEPPTNTLTLLGQALKSGPSVEDAPRWIRQAFLTQTSNADTHPCLRDRLHAMGRLPEGVAQGDYPSGPPPASGPRAAEFFLEAT